ncbi:MAG TPA: hypothetical protein VEH07_05700 [Alphaproteobacteria bacterium]|nr:hypothetical protein [Alphaproteobacteria bacterium]
MGGAWLQPKGNIQMISTVTYHSSVGGFDDRGNPVASKYARFELSPYVEYGATSWLTLGAEPRYQWAQSGEGSARQTAQGFGDIDLFVRAPLADYGPWVMSVQATAILAGAYERSRRPAPGTGENSYEARVLVARNLSARSPSYLNLEAAYRLGQGGVADQFRIDSALGLKPWRRWLLLEEMFLTRSIGTGDGASGHAYDLIKVRSSAVYSLTERIGVQLGYERDIEGTGVSLGDTGVLGLWIQF